MKEISKFLGNYFLFLVTTTLLAGMECSLWLQVFGDTPGPNFWIPTLVFWSLYRRSEEGVIMVYLLTLLLSAFTSLPGSLFLLCNMTLFSGLLMIRQRIYTSGAIYFMLLCGGASFGFYLIHFGLSWIYDSNPVTSPAWFHWLLEPLFTILVALPLLKIFYWFDHLTNKELPKEMEAIGHER